MEGLSNAADLLNQTQIIIFIFLFLSLESNAGRLIGRWKESDFFNKEFWEDQPSAYHMFFFAKIALIIN